MPARRLTYDAIPLPKSDYGATAYERGRTLVTEAGLRLSAIVWDADEILWDWVMDLSLALKAIPRLLRRDLTHLEFFRVKPGILELIWGMHHASIESGFDPYMRVWTDGYPWRLWRISRVLPGLTDLIGTKEGHGLSSAEAFSAHPRVFCRTDFAEAVKMLLETKRKSREILGLPPQIRKLLSEYLDIGTFEAGWKVPELAAMVGKDGFRGAQILVDDNRRNIKMFVRSGRSAVHLKNPTPRVLFGRIPNSVWRSPRVRLARMSRPIAEPLAAALTELATGEKRKVTILPSGRSADHPAIEFFIEISNERIREEWIQPIRTLRRLHSEVMAGQAQSLA